MAGLDTSTIKAKSGGNLTVTDDNNNETLVLEETASAVNEITIKNAATGNNPSIKCTGEANTGITFANSENEEILILDSVASSVNEVTIASAATGDGPIISATGETNVDLNLTAKGSGTVNITSDMKITGTTPLLTVGDAGAEDAMIVFDGNAADFRIGLDDGTDSLEIGAGSAHGTTTGLVMNSSGQVTTLNLAAAAVAVADDHLLIFDGGATGSPKAESIQDLLSAIAGSGISVSGNQLVADGGGEADAVAADNISAGDAAVNLTTSSGAITVDSNASTVSIDGHAGVTIASSNSGQVDITSAADVDINATTGIAVDATTVSIDGTDDSNVTVTGSAKDLDIAVAGGGTQELRLASAGTGTAAIHLNASAGGMDIDVADMLDIDVADEITIDTTSADGHIAITSAHTAGPSILISANADAGAILDIDAGILDVDIQAEATIDSVGMDINAGSGTLELTTTGAIDINGDAVTIDSTDDMTITMTSSGAGEDLTIQQVGGNDSSIHILAAGTGTDAIKIDATAGDMLIAPTLANGKTLKIGPTSATEMIFTPSGTASSEKISLTNTAGTAADAVAIVSTAGGITLTGDTDHGVLVGTLSGGPISIGHTTSETTVNDNLTVTGTTTHSDNVKIIDDKTLTFGTNDDWTIEYDENGDDDLVMTGDKLSIESATAGRPAVTVKNTNNDANGSKLVFEKKGGGAADDDEIAKIVFQSENSAGSPEDIAYVAMKALVSDITDGDESGGLKFEVMSGGTAGTAAANNLFSIGFEDVANTTQCEVAVNEAGVDCDFRAEGDSETHLLFVEAANDRVSIGASTDSPGATFEVTNASDGGVPCIQINSNDVDKVGMDINLANTTAIGIDIDAANTTGNIIDILSDDALTTGKVIHADINNGTTTALTPVYNHYDFDKDGVTADGVTQSFTMFDVDMNDAATNHANSTVNMIGMSLDVVSANAQGTLKNKGLVITCSGADKNLGLEVTAGTHLTMYNPADANDFGEISVGGDGVLKIKTNDSAAANANIVLNPNGKVVIETSTAPTVGGGFDAAAGSTPIINVSKVNDETITTVLVDIGGGSIVSSNTAGDAIGNDGVAEAFLFQLDKDVNGIIYKAELICVEAPTTGDADINVTLHADAKAEDAATESGGHVIINGGTQVDGKFTADDASAITAAAGGHNDRVYLTHGGTTAGTYDAGKLVIKLYGYKF